MRATRNQIKYIKRLAEEKSIDFEWLDLYAIRRFGASIENWQFTREAASQLIDEIRNGSLRE